ncbi:MAG: DUF1499 domain-containing protein [Xenococcaceae cyanobacterium MO_188.B32]|nr:DUF1499 domain-containing protein [Xenococcaceae cyanobacterium MO_188.B32]
MYRFISTILGILIVLTSSFILPTTAWAIPSSQIAALPIVKNIFAGHAPDSLGVNEGHLSSCPNSPNCVLSQDADDSHLIAPIVYDTDLDTARETLLKVLTVVPRTQVVEQTDNYIYAQSESRLIGFIDDLEFYFPPDEKVIHLRSASRLGESDLGVNRRRLEQIRFAFQDLNA